MVKISFYIIFILSQLFQHCFANEADVESVFVSILPQKYFIERIAGEHVNVSVMVGSGQNPATYEPTPKQMALLNKSKLYFQVGVPFENIWINVIRELNPELTIIDCCKELNSIVLEGHSHGKTTKVDKQLDPHVWTSPVYAKHIASKMKEALINILPAYKSEFDNNYSILIDELDELHQNIKLRMGELDNRYMIVSHPSWGYYAREYELIQVSIEMDGKEVRAKSLTKLIELSKKNHINRVFVQKQFNGSSANILAKEIGAEVIELDPLAENYIANLNYVTEVILD